MPDATYGSGIQRVTQRFNVPFTTGNTVFTIDHPGGAGVRYVDFQSWTAGNVGINNFSYAITFETLHVVDGIWRTFLTAGSGAGTVAGVTNLGFAGNSSFDQTSYAANEGPTNPAGAAVQRIKIMPGTRVRFGFSIGPNSNGNIYYTVTDET